MDQVKSYLKTTDDLISIFIRAGNDNVIPELYGLAIMWYMVQNIFNKQIK